MAKIALITDSHAGARSDSKIFDEYMNRFYREVFFPYLVKNKIKTVIHLGDAVDRSKYINYQTLHSLRVNVMEAYKHFGIDFHVIVGNHDIPLLASNKINAMNELFGHMDNVTVYDEPTEVEFDGRKMVFMPWINKECEDKASELMNGSDAEIMLGHFEFKGFQMYRGSYCIDGMEPETVKRFSKVLSGHFHTKSEQGNITYLGNPFELTWQDYGDDRGFHILDTANLSLEFVPNPFTMFEKIYLNEDFEVKKYDLDDAKGKYVRVIDEKGIDEDIKEAFITELENVGSFDVDVFDKTERITIGDDDEEIDVEDTLTVMLQYSKALNGGEENKQVDKLLTSLYTEASNMSVR